MAEEGEDLSGPEMPRELTLVGHRSGYLVPALVSVKEAIQIGSDHQLLVIFWPVAQTTDEGYIVLRDDHRILGLSRGAYKLLGLGMGDLSSGNVSILKWFVARGACAPMGTGRAHKRARAGCRTCLRTPSRKESTPALALPRRSTARMCRCGQRPSACASC